MRDCHNDGENQSEIVVRTAYIPTNAADDNTNDPNFNNFCITFLEPREYKRTDDQVEYIEGIAEEDNFIPRHPIE